MNKSLEKKYNLVMSLLQVCKLLQSEFGKPKEQSHFEVGTLEGMTSIPIPEHQIIFQSAEKQMIGLEEKYKNGTVIKGELDMILFNIKIQFNEGIGEKTELFWHLVKKVNINFNRKSNRLLNIVKKNYVSRMEDVDHFFPTIRQLKQSNIYSIAFSKEERKSIDQLEVKVFEDYILFLRNLATYSSLPKGIRKKGIHKLVIVIRYNSYFQLTKEEIEYFKMLLKYKEYMESLKL